MLWPVKCGFENGIKGQVLNLEESMWELFVPPEEVSPGNKKKGNGSRKKEFGVAFFPFQRFPCLGRMPLIW